MPPTAKRQTIINAVDARMKTILKANGYNSDLGAHVRVSPTTEAPDSWEWSMEIFFPGASPPDAAGVADRWDYDLDVDIDIDKKAASETDVSKMLADVLAAIGTDPSWSGLAFETTRPSHNPEWERRGRLVGAANLQFKIRYRAAPWTI
jgi:hypothetical protein